MLANKGRSDKTIKIDVSLDIKIEYWDDDSRRRVHDFLNSLKNKWNTLVKM